jgi:single-strand DNA-binding protein
MNDTITIVGTVGTDPEKKVRNGVPITTFRVASRERRFDRATGAWVDGETNWYTASAYRRLAEHAFESIHRRERVVLTGRLRVRNWDNGEKRGTSVDIDIDAIGHDLLFGTTTFRSDEAAAGGSAATADAWAADGTDEAWGSPGIERAGAAGSDAPVPSGTEPSGTEPSGTEPSGTASADDREGIEPRPLALSGVEAPF